MKPTAIALFAFLLIASGLTAQSWFGNVKGEGPIVERTLDVDDFDGFSLSMSGDVFVEQGSDFSVRVKGQENLIDLLNTEVKDGHWKIKFSKSVRNMKGFEVYITMPRLEEAYVSGSGEIRGSGTFTGANEVSVAVSGSGDIDLAFETEDIDAAISGSGSIRLQGNTAGLNITISGSGDVFGYDLSAANVKVQISGSGDAQVDASEMLEVRVSGSGDVTYEGTPRVKAKVSGSGDVESRSM